ncbi:hypothetical protein CK203_017523 [Vitis vinifera]|uniref:Transmembrane protein n=1 Tax=Vitis vinifera TaxID=29760 RepID=A0A438IXM6_VITVI|nr:hypothetical protein CK203_017523 [Vitis vinifera]
MDQISSRERDLEVDLGNCSGNTSEEDGGRDPVLGNIQANKLFSRVGNVNEELLIDISSRGEESRENSNLAMKQYVNEKHKKTNSRKPPKPPRPPQGPLLDAADQKFVREISELAMRRRARIERIKEMKKKKAAKASSMSSSSLSAMIITFLFFIIILFQGYSSIADLFSSLCISIRICSRASSHEGFQGSPEPVVNSRKSLISVQYYKNLPPNESNEPGSNSLNSVEQQVSGLKKILHRVYG